MDFINQLKFYPGNSKIDANRQDDLDSQKKLSTGAWKKNPNLEQNSRLIENWKAKRIVQCRKFQILYPTKQRVHRNLQDQAEFTNRILETQTAQQIEWWRLEFEAKLFPTRAAS